MTLSSGQGNSMWLNLTRFALRDRFLPGQVRRAAPLASATPGERRPLFQEAMLARYGKPPRNKPATSSPSTEPDMWETFSLVALIVGPIAILLVIVLEG